MNSLFGICCGVAVLIGMSSSGLATVEPECSAWFQKNKSLIGDVRCIPTCTEMSVDLGTFFCTDRCDELCRPNKGCDQYLKMLRASLTDGPPLSWDEAAEKSKRWKTSERDKIIKAILSLPRSLVEKSPFKIHRMSVAKLASNQASTKLNHIGVYDPLFSSSVPIARVLAHELAHVFWNDMARVDQRKFEIAANWIEDVNHRLVFGRDPKTATEPDGVFMPTEDFANSLEYFLFDPKTLKKLTPSLFEWFRNLLGAKFELGGECAKTATKAN